ncbi:hypothetical protein FISHEDRAFT_62138 [Fistulina hepatica ATCC 64428]|nr:hypothetical protein FISHEDRAFT_62138 [Fistulina hepatica ATCC 64428]
MTFISAYRSEDCTYEDQSDLINTYEYDARNDYDFVGLAGADLLCVANHTAASDGELRVLYNSSIEEAVVPRLFSETTSLAIPGSSFPHDQHSEFNGEKNRENDRLVPFTRVRRHLFSSENLGSISSGRSFISSHSGTAQRVFDSTNDASQSRQNTSLDGFHAIRTPSRSLSDPKGIRKREQVGKHKDILISAVVSNLQRRQGSTHYVSRFDAGARKAFTDDVCATFVRNMQKAERELREARREKGNRSPTRDDRGSEHTSGRQSARSFMSTGPAGSYESGSNLSNLDKRRGDDHNGITSDVPLPQAPVGYEKPLPTAPKAMRAAVNRVGDDHPLRRPTTSGRPLPYPNRESSKVGAHPGSQFDSASSPSNGTSHVEAFISQPDGPAGSSSRPSRFRTRWDVSASANVSSSVSRHVDLGYPATSGGLTSIIVNHPFAGYAIGNVWASALDQNSGDIKMASPPPEPLLYVDHVKAGLPAKPPPSTFPLNPAHPRAKEQELVAQPLSFGLQPAGLACSAVVSTNTEDSLSLDMSEEESVDSVENKGSTDQPGPDATQTDCGRSNRSKSAQRQLSDSHSMDVQSSSARNHPTSTKSHEDVNVPESCEVQSFIELGEIAPTRDHDDFASGNTSTYSVPTEAASQLRDKSAPLVHQDRARHFSGGGIADTIEDILEPSTAHVPGLWLFKRALENPGILDCGFEIEAQKARAWGLAKDPE